MSEPGRPSFFRDVLAGGEGFLWLVVASALLKLLRFDRLFREVPPNAPGPPLDARGERIIERVRRAVGGTAARLPWHPACLPQALAGALMCRVRGIRAPVALSVWSNQRFAAHAVLAAGSDAELTAATAPTGRTHLGRVVLTF